MVFKFIVAVAFIAAASGSGYEYAPSMREYHEEPVEHLIEDFNPHPQYTYTYGVQDVISGDSKSAIETRDGDLVHGEYSVLDADGFKRTVKYTADDINGFNAVVDRQPVHKEHAIAAPVVVKAALPEPAPVVVKSITHAPYNVPSFIKSVPITYAAPAYIKDAAHAYASHAYAPTFVKSVPANYETRSVFQPTFAYSAEPALIQSLPFTYNAAYSAPAAYDTHAFAKSAPVAYGDR